MFRLFNAMTTKKKRKSKPTSQLIFELNATSKQSVDPIAENVQRMFQIMIEMGGRNGRTHEVFAAMMDAILSAPIALTRYMGGSVLVADTQWKDTTPERAIVAALCDRLEKVIAEYNSGTITEYASPGEVLCFLHGASQVAPLQHEYAILHVWCSYQCMTKYNWGTEEVHRVFEQFGIVGLSLDADRVPKAFYPVAQDIRRSVIQSGKAKGFGFRRSNTDDTSDNDPTSSSIDTIVQAPSQLFFF